MSTVTGGQRCNSADIEVWNNNLAKVQVIVHSIQHVADMVDKAIEMAKLRGGAVGLLLLPAKVVNPFLSARSISTKISVVTCVPNIRRIVRHRL